VQNFVVSYILQNVKANFSGRNTLDALQQFAAYYRSLFEFPVIGLTGSNGKTIVKELNFLLSRF
jgi:alanine racemase